MNHPLRPVDKIFPKEAILKRAGFCPSCKCTVTTDDFKDDLSRKEFHISGLCMSCQDLLFDPTDDEDIEQAKDDEEDDETF